VSPLPAFFTSAYPSFIESSWSLNPGRSTFFFGYSLLPLSPLLLAVDKTASFQEFEKEHRIKQDNVTAFVFYNGKKKAQDRKAEPQ